MTKALCVGLIAGMATAAYGDVLVHNQIDVKARVFGSNDAWSDSLTFQSQNLTDPIVLEVAVFYSRNQGYGFSTCINNIVGAPFSATKGDQATIIDNPSSTQHPDGRPGDQPLIGKGWNDGGQFQVVYHTGTSGVDANRFRIAAPNNASDVIPGGISIHQRSPVTLGSNFNTEDGFMGYHFKLSLACYDGGAARSVVINAPNNRISAYRAYLTDTSATPTDIGGMGGPGNYSDILASDPATVNVSWVPGPGTVAILGCGGLVAGRRRRV